jgi:hypothetical protein
VIKPALCAFNAPHYGTLSNLLPFKLREHRQNTNHSATERNGGIKTLVHRNEVHAVRQKDFLNEIKRITLGARKTVKFIHQDDIETVYFINQLFNTGTLNVRARVPAVDIVICNQPIVSLAESRQAFFLRRD